MLSFEGAGHQYKMPEHFNRFKNQQLPTFLAKVKQDVDVLAYDVQFGKKGPGLPVARKEKKKEAEVEAIDEIASHPQVIHSSKAYEGMVESIGKRVNRKDHRRLIELVNKLPSYDTTAAQQRITLQRHGIFQPKHGTGNFKVCWNTQCCRGLLETDTALKSSADARGISIHYSLSRSQTPASMMLLNNDNVLDGNSSFSSTRPGTTSALSYLDRRHHCQPNISNETNVLPRAQTAANNAKKKEIGNRRKQAESTFHFERPQLPHLAIDVDTMRYTATALTPRQCRARQQQDIMHQQAWSQSRSKQSTS